MGRKPVIRYSLLALAGLAAGLFLWEKATDAQTPADSPTKVAVINYANLMMKSDRLKIIEKEMNDLISPYKVEAEKIKKNINA